MAHVLLRRAYIVTCDRRSALSLEFDHETDEQLLQSADNKASYWTDLRDIWGVQQLLCETLSLFDLF